MTINGVQFDFLLMAFQLDFLIFAINAINGVLLMAINENSNYE